MTGQLNLLVHLGTTENWLIQGVLTGAMDGIPTYGQSQPDGDYVGRGRTHCQGGICTSEFGSNRVERDMTIRVPRMTSHSGDTCDYDALTLLDAKVNVRAIVPVGQEQFAPIVHGTVVIHGILSVGAAGAFMVDDDMNLLKKAEEDMGDEIPRPFAEGWPITLYASAREVLFDNDPGHHIIDAPSRHAIAHSDRPSDCH